MIHVLIPFTVEQEKIEFVQKIIRTFISAIKENEPGTLMYRSFQQKEEPTKFVHVMTFKDEEAQQFHRNTSYCREFVEQLYPICTEVPQVAEYNEIEY